MFRSRAGPVPLCQVSSIRATSASGPTKYDAFAHAGVAVLAPGTLDALSFRRTHLRLFRSSHHQGDPASTYTRAWYQKTDPDCRGDVFVRRAPAARHRLVPGGTSFKWSPRISGRVSTCFLLFSGPQGRTELYPCPLQIFRRSSSLPAPLRKGCAPH